MTHVRVAWLPGGALILTAPKRAPGVAKPATERNFPPKKLSERDKTLAIDAPPIKRLSSLIEEL
jgi:hypothetical protein